MLYGDPLSERFKASKAVKLAELHVVLSQRSFEWCFGAILLVILNM